MACLPHSASPRAGPHAVSASVYPIVLLSMMPGLIFGLIAFIEAVHTITYLGLAIKTRYPKSWPLFIAKILFGLLLTIVCIAASVRDACVWSGNTPHPHLTPATTAAVLKATAVAAIR